MISSHTLSLRDGRKLGFAEYGKANGKPVLLLHGAPGSRLEHHPATDMADGLGLRLIVPDRPGYGLSGPAADRTFLSFAGDISELMDHLQLSSCPMLGFSGGGPYAMACAHQLPERVFRLGLASSMAPFDTPQATDGMNEQSKALFSLALADHDTFAAQIASLATNGEVLFHIMTAGLPPEDQVLFGNAAMRSMYQADMAEAVSQGVDGIVSDMLLYPRPWGFEPSGITCETLLWQGMKDINVPPAMGRHLASMIPQCRSSFLPEEAHYLLFNRWEEILSELVA